VFSTPASSKEDPSGQISRVTLLVPVFSGSPDRIKQMLLISAPPSRHHSLIILLSFYIMYTELPTQSLTSNKKVLH